MGLTLITAPAIDPIGKDDAKKHLRVEPNMVEEDDLIIGLVQSVANLVEVRTGRQLITATWELSLDELEEEMWLPRAPLQSVVSIKYTDTNGAEQTLASNLYVVDTSTEPGRIHRAYGATWPATRSEPNAVRIRYLSGYGDDPLNVPAALRQAILLGVGHLYENREAVNIGNITTVLPLAFDSLCNAHRIVALK